MRQVVGFFEIARQEASSPTQIWRRHGGLGAIPRTLFREYYTGSRQAVAILVGRAFTFLEPLSLAYFGVANHPQSFRYLASWSARKLKSVSRQD
jgi:predicted transcriptional regulator